MSGPTAPLVARLAEELHREFCDRACPPDSELHIASGRWVKHALSILTRLPEAVERDRLRAAVDALPMDWSMDRPTVRASVLRILDR